MGAIPGAIGRAVLGRMPLLAGLDLGAVLGVVPGAEWRALLGRARATWSEVIAAAFSLPVVEGGAPPLAPAASGNVPLAFTCARAGPCRSRGLLTVDSELSRLSCRDRSARPFGERDDKDSTSPTE